MPWNSTWPLGSVSVRSNKSTGQQNTTYLETTLKNDHYFNEDVSKDGYHKKTSMPNFGSTPGVPAGTDGVYYILTNGSEKEARYTNNGSASFHLNIWTQQLRGTFTSGALNTNFVLVSDIPTNAVGVIYIFRRNASPFLAMQGTFASNSTAAPNNIVHAFTCVTYIEDTTISNRPIILRNDPSNGNAIRGFVNDASYASKDFEYIVNYRII